MKTIHDIPSFQNVPILVRVSTNVPLENGKVANEFRLTRMLPTIQFLSSKGAKVILAGHIGRADTETLRPVYEALSTKISRLSFIDVAVGPRARDAARALHPGDVLLLENLRRYKGEESNDPAFILDLVALADVFVEDSFDVVHRMHASVVGVPKLLPSYAGLSLEREVLELSKALSPRPPSIAIVSGAKFETKEPVIVKLVEKYSQVFVGGAIANDLLKASGKNVGASLVSGGTDMSSLQSLLKSKRLLLPVDALVAPVGAKREAGRVSDLTDIRPNEAILDIGPKTSAMLSANVASAQTILWNGPLGLFENGFRDGTDALALAIAKSKAYSVIGGGDTVSAIEDLHLESAFSFVSTGGGAMLDFLAQGHLPGIDVLG